jgi:hypothetical protein
MSEELLAMITPEWFLTRMNDDLDFKTSFNTCLLALTWVLLCKIKLVERSFQMVSLRQLLAMITTKQSLLSYELSCVKWNRLIEWRTSRHGPFSSLKTQTAKKPFRCNQCLKSFMRQVVSIQHTRMHTFVKLYSFVFNTKNHSLLMVSSKYMLEFIQGRNPTVPEVLYSLSKFYFTNENSYREEIIQL